MTSHLPMKTKHIILAMVCGLTHSAIHAQTINFEAAQIKGGKKATASCVVIDDQGTLATVVELGADMKKATLVVDGKNIPLTYVVNDVNSRLAIYKTPPASKGALQSPVDMGSSMSLQPSHSVFASGRADEDRVVAKVSRFQGKILPLAVFRINHGQKSPLPGTGIYDTDKKLVGIVRQTVFDSAQSSYCLPVEVIARIRKDMKQNGKIRRCWIGIVMDELVAPPIIESVRPDSPAAKAGLKNGDVILSIGAHQVNNYAEVVDAFFYLIAGDSQIFKVLRGTEIKEIKVTPEASPKRS